MASRPNIVLILADDMGYGDVGAFGDGGACTPALDQLVEQGVCLSQHYSASPVCAPARAALLSGKYPHRVGTVDTLEGRGTDRLSLRERTLADHFRQAGYVTGLVGKWHNGALDPRYHPNARGFDEFAGFRGGWQDYYQWRLDRNGQIHKCDGRYLTDVFTQEALEFVRRHARQPFLLMLTYNAPHFPFQVPEEELEPFIKDGRTRAVSTIYAMNRRMDRGVAAVLEELANLRLEENTLVMFTSDNGPQFGGKDDLCTTRFNCGLNGSKCTVYEGGIRLPMVMRWPAGGLSGGREVHEMAHLTDWLPTLAAAAGVKLPSDLGLDGVNILPVLQGLKGKVCTRRFWQWNRYDPVVTSNAAMRDGPWKLLRPIIRETMRILPEDSLMDRQLKYEPDQCTDILRTPLPPRDIPQPPAPKLFNLAADPLEQQDLAQQQPERVRRMLRELETWFEQVEAQRRSIRD